MRTTRKLSTGDSQDFVIPLDTPMNFAWATNSNNQVLNYHTERKHMMVVLPSDGTPLKIAEASGALYLATASALATLSFALV